MSVTDQTETGLLSTGVEQALERRTEEAEAGTTAARAIHDAVLRGGDGVRNFVDVLHGTWLGHPLHPVLTDFVIGAWGYGCLFDAVGVLRDSDAARQTGDQLALLGTLAAVPTAVTGVADFSVLPKEAVPAATLHALANVAGVGLYLLSLRDRRNGRRGRGLFFSGLAQGLTLVSSWLGGHLVYKHRIGVDHSDTFDGPAAWTPVLDEADLPEREARRVEFDGKGVVLYREGDEVRALGAVCSHAGGPLEEGKFKGGCVQCPWHDSVFGLRDGHIVHGPATQPQPAFAARLRGGRVEIRLLHD